MKKITALSFLAISLVMAANNSEEIKYYGFDGKTVPTDYAPQRTAPNQIVTEVDKKSSPESIVSSTNSNQPIVTDLMVDNPDFTLDELKKTYHKRNEIQRELSTIDTEDINLINRDIEYNYDDYKNDPIVIYLRRGYITELEFVDEIGTPMEIAKISVGNKLFNLSKTADHILNIEPIVNYKNTNMNIRLKGYPYNITFKVVESDKNYENQVDNLVKIVFTKKQTADMTEWDIKRNILKELYRNASIRGAKELSYEIFDDSDNITSVKYMNKQDLKIYKVNKFGKQYLVVNLSVNYNLLGLDKAEFSKYQESFKIYFLPYSTQTFRVVTNKEDRGYILPTNKLQEDNGLIESYRVVIKD